MENRVNMRFTSAEWGIARTYALIFGIAYLAVAILEDVLGSKGWVAGDAIILKVTGVQNAIHWIVGLAVLGSFFAGEMAAKMVSRVVGIVFVVVSLLGIFARTFTGKLLGFHGPLPWSYNIVHVATAIFALVAGFAAAKLYSDTRA